MDSLTEGMSNGMAGLCETHGLQPSEASILKFSLPFCSTCTPTETSTLQGGSALQATHLQAYTPLLTGCCTVQASTSNKKPSPGKPSPGTMHKQNQ
mmetsp:Transcript_90537/g.151456  ORF Transcript_90537/g.151456 Transcript_90537/m.151456 type:complete len:96 (-) Transcript_90537:434-721(-)